MPPTQTEQSNTCDCLEVTFLGSGSSGNATFITCGTDAVLVDCGFSARETLRRLADAGADPARIRAILVTHEHSDHISGVRVVAKRLGVPVYATRGTVAAAPAGSLSGDLETLIPGEPLTIGRLEILPFDVSHDAAQPVGFRFTGSCGTSLGLITDTGHVTPATLEALQDCELLGIECNHDLEMLQNGPYPWFLKQRIMSARGHLSNPDAMAAIEMLASDRLRSVFGVHVSSKNNTHSIVAAELRAVLDRIGISATSAPVEQHRCSTPARGVQAGSAP